MYIIDSGLLVKRIIGKGIILLEKKFIVIYIIKVDRILKYRFFKGLFKVIIIFITITNFNYFFKSIIYINIILFRNYI